MAGDETVRRKSVVSVRLVSKWMFCPKSCLQHPTPKRIQQGGEEKKKKGFKYIWRYNNAKSRTKLLSGQALQEKGDLL